ncbi:tamm41, partial [Symbiodinium microadriaticum]
GENSSGVAMWFNVDVAVDVPRLQGRSMKYGVIKTSNLLQDLLHWKHLYVAGRLHKPIHIIHTKQGQMTYTDDNGSKATTTILDAFVANRTYALRVVLLTLPESFSEMDLYIAIAGISYRGDPRMLISENPHKVTNIVKPNMAYFREVYSPLLLSLQSLRGVTRTPKSSPTLLTSFLKQQQQIQEQEQQHLTVKEYVELVTKTRSEVDLEEDTKWEVHFHQEYQTLTESQMRKLLPSHLFSCISP